MIILRFLNSMKIVEAQWEKRNLKKRVFEIEIEISDNVTSIQKALQDLTADYVVIKLSTKLHSFIDPIQTFGFKFIELITHTKYEGQLPELNAIEERFLAYVSANRISQSNLNKLRDQINSGMFQTDRISLDAEFGKEFSARRYLGMIEDECSRGAQIYQISFEDQMIGFFVLREVSQGLFLSSLGGIFPNFQNKGFGVLMNYFQIYKSFESGGNQIYSTFSSNNLGATAIHWRFNYSLANQEYIFIKHY